MMTQSPIFAIGSVVEDVLEKNHIDLGLGVEVSGLVFSMITELQAIALTLKCILSFHSVDLFLDSQAALNACKSEFMLACPDFKNWCWIKHHYIANVIHHKNLDINWIKVKSHSGVFSNKHANAFAKAAAFSDRCLLHVVSKHFLQADGTAVSNNSQHFVYNIFQSIYCVHWEVGSGFYVLMDGLHANVDWSRSLLVWHSDSYLTAGFTSARTAGFLCLFCGDVEVLDHVFSCSFDTADCAQLIKVHVSA
ncbi:hypothetical protein G9A89_006962 [Geosiphon pyriformis]|nr:hypothetical protein G9A89_006962 [Geosiphon pyriformis]